MAKYIIIRNKFRNKRLEVLYRNALLKQMNDFMAYIAKKNLDGLSFSQLEREFRNIDRNIDRLEKNVKSIFTKYFTGAKRQYLRHQQTAFEQAGIERNFMAHNPSYDRLLRISIEQNVNLITNTSRSTVHRIRTALYENVKSPQEGFNLEGLLRGAGEYSENRIKLIARDQTAKLNASLNEITQKEAGIEYFKWVTAGDERVSTGEGGHEQLDGKIYRWDEPENYPIIDTKGNRGPPSKRPRCRCLAMAIVITKSDIEFIQNADRSYRIV